VFAIQGFEAVLSTLRRCALLYRCVGLGIPAFYRRILVGQVKVVRNETLQVEARFKPLGSSRKAPKFARSPAPTIEREKVYVSSGAGDQYKSEGQREKQDVKSSSSSARAAYL
jgi:hypothetical protein